MAGTKNFFVSKNQFCHAHQPCKGIFEICFVFSHFFVRASNCSHYSNFGNKCPKLGTGIPEDMILTNLGDNLDSDPSGFVLIVSSVKFVNRSTKEAVYDKLLILNKILKTVGISSQVITTCITYLKKAYYISARFEP